MLTKRWILLLSLGILLLLAAGTIYAQGGDGDDEHGGGDLAYGAALYAEFCQACHGPDGTGAGTGPAFAAIRYEGGTIRDAIANGQDSDAADGVAMAAYGAEAGGPLSPEEIDALVAYVHALAAGDAPPLPEPSVFALVESVAGYDGDPEAGARVYATSCYGCHGKRGVGRGGENFPAFAVTDDSLVVVRAGSGNGIMPAFGADAGGPLSEDQLADLDAYLASWDYASDEIDDEAEGVNFLMIFLGVMAIVGVGAAYLSSMVKTET